MAMILNVEGQSQGQGHAGRKFGALLVHFHHGKSTGIETHVTIHGVYMRMTLRVYGHLGDKRLGESQLGDTFWSTWRQHWKSA